MTVLQVGGQRDEGCGGFEFGAFCDCELNLTGPVADAKLQQILLRAPGETEAVLV